jgi:UDP-glucose:(heptosyl)LPS alpha-1,3-glucosyltransferase
VKLRYNRTVKKKIAIIIERADVRLGGAERSVFELAAALSSLELDVNILAAKGASATKNVKVLCEDMPGKRTAYHTFERTLKEHLEQNQYDIVHSVLPFDLADVYQPRGGAYAESIRRNCASYPNRFTGLYKSVTAFANFRRSVLLRAEKKLCKNPDGPIVAALSDYVAQQFRTHYSLDRKRIAVIPNGVRTNRPGDAKAADKLRSHILRQLRIAESDNPVLFLFVANNFRLKGLTPLLRAFHGTVTEKAKSPAYLIVAGHGSIGRYRRLAAKLNILNKIVFLGPQGHINDALAVTSVAVLPTYYDPSSRFILEALSAHTPVITTRFNGAVDLFVSGRHGTVIDSPEDIPALTKALNHFTDSANIQRASAAIVEDKLEENISIKRVAKQLMSLYISILPEGGRK